MTVLTETADAIAGTSTTYSMDVGDYFFGSLGTASDSDWIEVSLVAGQTYTFGLNGVGVLSDNLDDTYLRLRDSAGTQIAFDDDSGPGRNSAITFTATTTGTYYLDVQSWNNTLSGDYGLSMTSGSRASYDVMMGAGAMLRRDLSWAATPGTAVTVTWGVRATGPATDADNNPAPFSVLSAAQAAAAQQALAMFEGVSGLTLTQVNPGGTTDSATILFGGYTSTTDGAGAYAYSPGSTAAGASAGDIWLNNNSISTSSLPMGSFSNFAILHEMGHAVGLAHPGDYNAAPGTTISYDNDAPFTEDTYQYTVMSYFDESNTTTSVGSYPDTLMLYDIYALQQLYGADMTFNAGDTTYGFNATVGGAYDFTTNTTPFLSIWDGGGTDTLDLSGYSMAQTISLEAGAFSSVGGYAGNLSIAIGAVIENAVGGGGADTITGNSADNTITGGGGNDTFVMALNRAAATITEIVGGFRVVSALGTDTLIGVEFIQFDDQLLNLSTTTPPPAAPTPGDDALTGTAGADLVSLLEGNDSMAGGDGNDTLYGNQDNDTLNGDAGDDNLLGGFGEDLINGGDGNDSLSGGGDNDQLNGDAGNDTLIGNLNNDTLNGGAGNDLLYGGKDNDSLSGDVGDDLLYGQKQNDTLSGGDGNDSLFGGEGEDLANGGNGNDQLHGWMGADRLNGDADNDTLYGNQGNDTMDGGSGDDLLYGGKDNDSLSGGGDNDDIHGQNGNDILNGDAGSDRLYGGQGDDTLNGNLNDDQLYGALGADLLSGGDGNDLIYGGTGDAANDTLYGGAGNDTLNGHQGDDLVDGGEGADQIDGARGRDTMIGGDGDDRINGGLGSDTLTGGGGADTFVFAFGWDRITDFEDNIDTIELDDALWAGTLTVQDVINTFATVSGGTVVFDFGASNQLTVAALGGGVITDASILLDDIVFV